MTVQKFIENSILIQSSASEVWDALINPKKTKMYMFGCETVSTWKVPSELLWKGSYEGVETIFVKGNVLAYVPNSKLVYTVFDPLSTLEDVPENYLTVTYALTEENGQTRLSVTQGDFTTVAEGERRFKDCWNNGEGWNPTLEQIKKLVEEGERG